MNSRNCKSAHPALLCLLLGILGLLVAAAVKPEESAADSAPQQITVVFNSGTPPLKFSDPQGRASGLLVDLWRLWGKKTGITVKFLEAPWDETLRMVREGEADVHAGLFFTEERDRFLDYTSALLEIEYLIFHHRTILGVEKLQDLKAFRIGVPKGFTQEFVSERLPQAALGLYPDFDHLYRAAFDGEVRVFVSPLINYQYFLKQNESEGEFDYDVNNPLYQQTYFGAVREGNHALRQLIDRGLASITREERAAIERKWLGQAKTDTQNVLTIAGSRNLPPFSMLNEAGEPVGIGIDLWRLWSRKSGRPIQFRLTDISRSLSDLRDKRADLHAGLFRSKERAEWLAFSKPFLRAPATLYHLFRESRPPDLVDFSSARIGVQGPPPAELFQSLFPSAKPVSFENITQMVAALERGEIDAFVADRPSADLELVRSGLRGDIVALEQDLFEIDLRAAVPRDKEDLLQEIEQGMNAISRNELAAILGRWLGGTVDYNIYLPQQHPVQLTPEEQTWIKQHRELRIAVDPEFAPYEFLDETGKHQGVSADYLKLLERKLGVRFTLVPTKTWDESVGMGFVKQIDVLPLINRTPSREPHLLFTEPYFISRRVIITRGQRDDIREVSDLANRRLVLPAGYSVNEHIRENIPDAQIIEVTDIPSALRSVAEGAVDATILSIGVASYWLDRSELTNLRIAGQFGRPSTLSMACRNDWPELASILQKALASISEDEHLSIRRRWISLDDDADQAPNLGLTPQEHTWLRQHPVIATGGDADWPPVAYVDRDGTYRGISADYLQLLQKRLGIEFSAVTDTAWSELLDRARNRNLDLIASISRSEEREQYLGFTHPYFSVPYTIYRHHDGPDITTLKELRGLTVAVEKDFYLHERLSLDFPAISLLVVENTVQALEAVSFERADAYIGNPAVAEWLIEQNRLHNLKAVATAPILGKSEMRLGVRKDWPLLLSALNKGFASITPEEHRKIRHRWMGQAHSGEGIRTVLTESEQEWLAAHSRIRIGFDASYSPYSFLGPDGIYRGVAADFIRLLGERLGVDMEAVPGLDWPQILQGAREHTLDVIATAVQTPERDEFLEFTSIYIPTPLVIMSRADNTEILGADDLSGRRVALVEAHPTSQRVRREHPAIKEVPVKTPLDGLREVALGKADAYVGVLGINVYLTGKHGITNLKVAAGYDAESDGQRFGVRKDWPELARILEKALAATPEAEKFAIFNRWVPAGAVAAKSRPALESLQLNEQELKWLQQHREIRLGVDPDWEPIEFVTPKGEYSGISSEFIQRISVLLEMEMKHTPGISWQEVLNRSKRREIDILPAVTPSLERARYLNFTKPYLHFPFMVFTRKDAPLLTGIADLGSGRVAVERGYVTEEYLKRDHPHLSLQLVETTAQALHALATGEVDAYVGNLTLGSYLIDKLGLGNIKVSAPTPYANDLAIGVRKDWPELLAIMDKALATIDEAERQKIRQQSLAIRYQVAVDYTLLWQVVAGAALLLLLTLLWLAQVRSQRSALAVAKAEADQANRFKSYFLANMSHEIRTPMNAIVGFSHLAQQSGLDRRQQGYVDKIQSSAYSLLGIINDILDFSRIEAGKLHIDRALFSLDEVMENLAHLNIMRAEEKGLELLFSRDLKIPDSLEGDSLRLGQILTNLVSNAIKFTRKGEVKVVTLLKEQQSDQVLLSFAVEDTGIGIEPDQVERLFQAFTQLDGSTTRQHGGSGLGLSICRHLVQLMGGTLELESTPGKGSRFSFELAFKFHGEPRARNLIPDTPLRGLRALVVDDNPSARQILKEMLTSFTFDVVTAPNAETALGLIQDADEDGPEPFRLVLMDWRLPLMDGIEAIRRIKQDKWLSHTPAVILVTAYGREEVLQSAEKAGTDAVLIKPVSPSALFETVLRALGAPISVTAENGHKASPLKRRLSGRVLLVEDNIINQQLAQELLETMGLLVQTVCNGQEALETLRKHQFDLVLMDIQMPDMDGYQATRTLRADPRFASLPVIALTAHAMAGEREKCLNAGMNDHVPKPIEPELLYNILSHWLKQETASLQPHTEEMGPAAYPVLPDSVPGINLRWGLERVGGNRQLFQKLLGDFLSHHGNDLEELEKMLVVADREGARRLVHTLRGVAGNIGATAVQAEAARLESDLTQAKADLPAALPEAFVSAFSTLLSGLTQLEQQADTRAMPEQESADLKSIDSKALLHHLEQLLEEGDPQAKELIPQLQTALPQRALKDTLQQLGELVDSYDFDRAQEQLVLLSKILTDIPDE